jgi:hypothetical protein
MSIINFAIKENETFFQCWKGLKNFYSYAHIIGMKDKFFFFFRGGLYHIKANKDISARIAKLTRKVEAIELSKVGVAKIPTPIESTCEICEANVHLTKDCPTIPAFKEVLHE